MPLEGPKKQSGIGNEWDTSACGLDNINLLGENKYHKPK
jgi:hypothetical protein